MIKSFNGLRLIFILMIFMHHFALPNGKAIFPNGHCGATFFFIISGFVLSFQYNDLIINGKFSIKNFLKKRIKKIYPLHLLCLGAVVLMTIKWYPSLFKVLIVNLFLIQSWIPNSAYFFSFNAASWFLSDIIFFYLCLKPIVLLSNKISLWFFGLGILLEILFLIITIKMNIVSEEYIHWVYYIFPLTRLLDFIIGIFLCKIYFKLKDYKLNIFIYSILELTSWIVLIVAFLFANGINQLYMFDIYFLIPLSVIILVFSLSDQQGLFAKLLGTEVFQQSGKYIMTFFIVHTIVIDKCLQMDVLHLRNSFYWGYFIICLLTTVLISVLIDKFFINKLKL